MNVPPTLTRPEQLHGLVDDYGRLLLPQPTPDVVPINRIASAQANESGRWAATNGTIAANTASFSHGSQSMQLVCNSGATVTATFTPATAYEVIGNAGVSLNVADLAQVDSITLYLDETDGNGYSAVLYGRTAAPWNRYLLASGQWRTAWAERFVSYGTPTAWGTGADGAAEALAVYRVRIVVVAATACSPVVNIGSILTQAFPHAVLLIHLDDCHPTQLSTVYPLLEAHGMRAGLGMNKAYTDQGLWEDYGIPMMSSADIDTLYAAGWDVHNHGVTHMSFGSNPIPSVAAMLDEYCVNREFAQSNGWERGSNFILTPYLLTDTIDHTAAAALASVGFLGSRGRTIRDANDVWPTQGDRCAAWMPRDLMNWSYCDCSTTNKTAATLTLKQAIQRHQVMLAMFHDVAVSPTSGGTSLSDFTTFIDLAKTYADAGQLIVNWTFDDLYTNTWGKLSPYKSYSLYH